MKHEITGTIEGLRAGRATLKFPSSAGTEVALAALFGKRVRIHVEAIEADAASPITASTATAAPSLTPGCRIAHTMPRGAALHMRYVPAGKFSRGSEDGDSDERPVRVCEITRGFYVAEHPTTVGEFRAFAEATGHVTTAEREKATRTWRSPGFPQTDDHPVVCVSWDDAQAFCAWAGLRLLTETEWEYTARGTDGRTYPWGNEAPDDTRLIWSGSGTPRSGTAPVGQCPAGASPFGVLDLAGNVWEWCADWYATYPKGKSVLIDPTGPDSGDCRVLRGASWYDGSAWIARAAFRDGVRPSFHYGLVGFRAARGEI